MTDPSSNKTDPEVGRRTLRIELAPKTLITIVAMVVAVALLTRLVPGVTTVEAEGV